MADYRGQHQAPDVESGQRFDTLGEEWIVYPLDVRDNPHYYGAQHRVTIDLIRAAKSGQRVTIYRAVPPGVDTINPGDWVAIAKDYAREHSYGLMDGSVADGSADGIIISAEVPVETLYGEGALEEWGYNGPAITGLAP